MKKGRASVLISLVAAAGTCACLLAGNWGGAVSESQRQSAKQHFLSQPVFESNLVAPSTPAPAKTAASSGNTPVPVAGEAPPTVQFPANLTNPSVAGIPSSTAGQPAPGRAASVRAAVTSSRAAAQPMPTRGPDGGICGWNRYLTSYCFYPVADGNWRICAGRFGGCVARAKTGCFASGTRVQMQDGSWKRVDRIRIDDKLKSALGGASLRVKRVVVGPERLGLVELVYRRHRLRVTVNHPIATPAGIRAARALRRGDFVLGRDRKYHPLLAVSRIAPSPGELVWNFIFDGAQPDPARHLLVADGFVTGDYFLQQEIEKGIEARLP